MRHRARMKSEDDKSVNYSSIHNHYNIQDDFEELIKPCTNESRVKKRQKSNHRSNKVHLLLVIEIFVIIATKMTFCYLSEGLHYGSQNAYSRNKQETSVDEVRVPRPIDLSDKSSASTKSSSRNRSSLADGNTASDSILFSRFLKPNKQIIPIKSLKNYTVTDNELKTSASFLGVFQCAMFLKGGGCLTYGMIEWALTKAKETIGFSRPENLAEFELDEATINTVGELVESTTRILAQRFSLNWEEISFGLESVDTSLTSLWRTCPRLFRSLPTCSILTRYRTHTGHCNNPIAGYVGAANMPYLRQLPPDYADGVGIPRRSSSSGGELPPVRLLAINLHPDIENPSRRQSVLFMAWGQLLNHDISLASGARAGTGHGDPCCRRNNDRRVCMPFEIGVDDPHYSPYGIRCHEFKRSLSGLRPGCSLGPRTQINTVTSFVDGSFVYGSSRTMNRALRRNRRGLMSVWNYFEEEQLLPLLPPQQENPDEECIGREPGRYCFLSGDLRTNQQIQLVALHTVHTRQHNRLASALSRLNPHWNDNKVYHEARHIHIALIQHILLNEYLPNLLGPELCSKYKLIESPVGSYWDHYDPTINPSISQAFSAAAFRQGHSTVPNQVFRFNNQHEPVRVYQLRDLYRQPWALFEPGAMDEFLLGTLNVPAQSFDPFIGSDLSGQLLKTPREPVGLDLTSINIQRGRDQGVPGYNAFRGMCGLRRARSFDDLDSYMSSRSSQIMSSLYESVDDIDLFTGGISEFPLEGAQVGPTFACLIGQQFQQLRSGDRYWFESSQGPHAFTMNQLDSIKQFSLARLICANSDSVDTIQQLALNLAHPVLNPLVLCDMLPDIDITLWFDPLGRSSTQAMDTSTTYELAATIV